MMTMDERVEAATAAIRKFLGDAVLSPTAEYIARIALQAGVPELHGDKPGWIAPWEATEEMATKGAVYYHDNWRPGHALEDTAMPYIWDAMRDAYLGKGDGG